MLLASSIIEEDNYELLSNIHKNELLYENEDVSLKSFLMLKYD